MSKLIFITGASSGIGQALALCYYKAGYSLALVARRTSAIQVWADQQALEPNRYAIYGADVAVIDQIVAAGEKCLQQQGVPDLVIASAGISQGVDSAIREDLDVIAHTLAVNTVGVAATFHPFIAPMVSRGKGTLVGLASVAGIRGLPGHGAYCASKAGAIAYCESLRGELGASGIKVITLCPGYIDTPLTRQNAYPMPFLMNADNFATQTMQAIEAGVSYQVLPWQMGWVAKVLRLMPNWLLDMVLHGRPRKHRGGAP